MHRISGSAVALSLTLAALLVGATPASAATDPAIRAALHRIDEGTYSAADLDLIRAHPRIAAQVPDPSRRGTSGSARGSRAGRARLLGTRRHRVTCGAWVDVWYRKRSLLGSTIYRWHHRVVYCHTRRHITRWQNRYDYLTDAQSIIYIRELVVNQQGGLRSPMAWSHVQRHLEYCVVRYGCYANTYPWSRIQVHADGRYTYTGSAD